MRPRLSSSPRRSSLPPRACAAPASSERRRPSRARAAGGVVLAAVLAALVMAPRPARADGDPLDPGAGGGAATAGGARAPEEATATAAPTVTVDADPGDLVPGEIAVDVRDDATTSDLQELARAYGLTLRPNSPWSDAHDKIELADVDPAREQGILDALGRDARVEHAEPLSVLRATFVPDDPMYAAKQWHLQRVGAERAWDYACGRGVTVAVIDTGVACWDKGPFTRGSDLSGTRCDGGYDFVNDRDEAADDHGHGTHVAGTIAQTTNNGRGVAGLAYCARLMPIKVLTKQGWGTVSDVAEGIRFAADEGAQVINLSLGGSIKSAILEDAVKHARARGVTIVAAAGNSGRRVGWPAAYDGVVAVSATDANDRIAWFSSRGAEVAIAAPGVGVTQQTVCDGGRNKCELFGTFNGTSMASPHVAGAAAMIVGLGVSDPDAVRAALTDAARPKEDATLYGAGLLDAGGAAARTWWRHVAFRGAALLVLAGLVARRIRKRGGVFARGLPALVGALVGAVGLAPFAPLVTHASASPAIALASRPLAEWDGLLGAGVHRWLLGGSFLVPLALFAILFGVRRARPLLGGLALGTAAFAAHAAIAAEVAFPFGALALRAWMIASALVCLWLARLGLDRGRSN